MDEPFPSSAAQRACARETDSSDSDERSTMLPNLVSPEETPAARSRAAMSPESRAQSGLSSLWTSSVPSGTNAMMGSMRSSAEVTAKPPPESLTTCSLAPEAVVTVSAEDTASGRRPIAYPSSTHVCTAVDAWRAVISPPRNDIAAAIANKSSAVLLILPPVYDAALAHGKLA